MDLPRTAVKTRGLALIVVIGILGVLAMLAVAFVAMAELERRASMQRVNAARAYLLARSGIEDALARLELGQDPRYGGEDWDASGTLNGFEGDAETEVYHRGILNTEDCPVRHALRPSFFVASAKDLGSDGKPAPERVPVDGRGRGYSGVLKGDYASVGNAYVLKVQPSNAGIYINGGALDAQDRDPDGPGAKPEDFPLNPDAAAEVAPLLPNGIPDHRDPSMEGPNGFLVRLLNNLEAVVTDGASAGLGAHVVGARPVGGYKSLDELPDQAKSFKPYLTLHAWVDPKVVKPQPMDGRPQRWEDIDDAHRVGVPAREISGVRTLEAGANPAGGIQLSPLLLGNGREADPASGDLPWTQVITAANTKEVLKVYPVSWERGFVYAWSQLRPASPAFEPRAPVVVHLAPEVLLAAVFLGLRGTSLEVWDGSAGWDAGFGWYLGAAAYPYPSPGTEETPWHRTRLDYGMTYGTADRPWYGPADYDPHAPPSGGGGKPVVQAAPLGRLKETAPISLPQAKALAGRLRQRILEAVPLRTWARFHAFVDALPGWEDVNGDGFLDGLPYPVVGGAAVTWQGGLAGAGEVIQDVKAGETPQPQGTFTPQAAGGVVYTRRMYAREDRDSDGVMDNETFPDGTQGLTFLQKDVIRAMANPNTDVNDFNPDANLWKEVDKLDLAGIAPRPEGYVHTTELALDEAGGPVRVGAAGRVSAPGGRVLAFRVLGAAVRLHAIHRDTTQADFRRDILRMDGELSGSSLPYSLAGGAVVRSHPEPRRYADGFAVGAAYDGQVSLGFIAPAPRPGETLGGALCSTLDAAETGDEAVPDLRGPFQTSLLGAGTGNLFADGAYSEKDRTLRFRLEGNLFDPGNLSIACWVKPHWFPEASPRAHALLSLSRGAPWTTLPGIGPTPGVIPRGPYNINAFMVPLDDIRALPVGLYFAPARNNFWEGAMGIYAHNAASTLGNGWPRRALLWGSTHCLFASDCLNRRGIETPLAKPLGRLEAHRWQHLAVGQGGTFGGGATVVLGRRLASADGGGHGSGWLGPTVRTRHVDGADNHIRFGEMASIHNMNYAADATFANLRVAPGPDVPFFTGPSSPAVLGRYLKEDGAAYVSPTLPAFAGGRLTWTEIPCDLRFDEDADGWAERLENDRDADGLRDVRIALEVWRGSSLLEKGERVAVFHDAAGENRLPASAGDLRYRAVFVNAWDPATRANFPLDVTPFLDDVTILYQESGGPRILSWDQGGG